MRKILAILVASSVVFFNNLSVFAASNVNIESEDIDYQATTSITANFSAEMLGNDVIINVPAQVRVDNSSELDNTFLITSGTVTMKGDTGETEGIPNYLRLTIEPRTVLTNTENSDIKVETINVFSNLDCGELEGISKHSVCNSMSKPIVFDDSTMKTPYQDNVNCVQLRREATLATAWTTISFKIRANEIPVIGTYIGTTHYYVNRGSASNLENAHFAKN